MKFYKISDIDGFFQAVDKCKGRVELVTKDGDCLNLKSQLMKYLSLATVFSGGEIGEMEIVVSEQEDMDKLIKFILCNN